jgi:ATP-dependent Clp protease ATP-binding subunit ClpC
MGADMFERFTNRARRVVVLAQEEARILRHNYIGTEHLLLGILAEGDGTAFRALAELGVTLEIARQQVEGIVGTGQNAMSGHIPFTPRAKKVLELSLREALKLGHNYIGTEHILLGIIREGDGVGAQVLTRLGDDLSVVRMHVIRLAPTSGEDPAETASVPPHRTSIAGQPGGVLALLEDISVRLANIERHLGISRPQIARGAGTGAAEPGAETAGAAAMDPAAGADTGADAGDDGPDAAKG